MTDVFVYDHVRTPRGRGKKRWGAARSRATGRAPGAPRFWKRCATATASIRRPVDDIVMGCVDPVCEAGAVIPEGRRLRGRLTAIARRACRSPASAPRASMLSISQPAKIAAGADDIVIAGGVEIDVARRHGHVGRRLVHGPVRQLPRPISCRRASRPT